jgi:hypothetical protein
VNPTADQKIGTGPQMKLTPAKKGECSTQACSISENSQSQSLILSSDSHITRRPRLADLSWLSTHSLFSFWSMRTLEFSHFTTRIKDLVHLTALAESPQLAKPPTASTTKEVHIQCPKFFNLTQTQGAFRVMHMMAREPKSILRERMHNCC